MKPAQIKALRKRIIGSVTDAPDALDYFATDGSVFTVRPSAIIYPKDVKDVQETVAYASAEASKGKKFSLTGRGRGSDQSGGALGEGAMVVFPAHMNRIKKLTKDSVTVQPGLLYSNLQQALHTHKRFLPPYPASIQYASIGGAVANNSAGEKSVKYGATDKWVGSLKVVLDDGSLIETKRISKRELNRKKGLMTREGDLYRRIDGLLMDHKSLITETVPQTTKNTAGYRLDAVKGRDGSIDLTELFIGAQGTLGLITEITLKTALYDPKSTLLVGYFDSLEKLSEAVLRLRKLGPSALELVDHHLLTWLRAHQPELVEQLPDDLPQALLLVEFDNPSHVRQTMLGRRAARVLYKYASQQQTIADAQEQSRMWRVRRSAAAVIWMTNGPKKALPIIEDACVPVENVAEFLEETYKILRKHKLEIAVWGHAGDGNFHLQPFLDLAKLKDRKLVFTVMDEFYTMVVKLGGTIGGEHNDGRLRAPYLEKLYGQEMVQVFEEVKQICDPHGIFNPGVKVAVSKKDVEPLLRHEYSMKHLYDYMPHS